MRDIVVLVEDDPDMREDLAFLIRQSGREVIVAAHGLEALEKLAEIEHPCLIILDLMMPVMDGWEFRARLAEHPVLSEVPIVVLSGKADVRDEAQSLGAVDYITKPVDLDRLYGLVGSLC